MILRRCMSFYCFWPLTVCTYFSGDCYWSLSVVVRCQLTFEILNFSSKIKQPVNNTVCSIRKLENNNVTITCKCICNYWYVLHTCIPGINKMTIKVLRCLCNIVQLFFFFYNFTDANWHHTGLIVSFLHFAVTPKLDLHGRMRFWIVVFLKLSHISVWFHYYW